MVLSDLLKVFWKNKENVRDIRYSSSLDDISQNQVILIYGLKHLITNIDR